MTFEKIMTGIYTVAGVIVGAVAISNGDWLGLLALLIVVGIMTGDI